MTMFTKIDPPENLGTYKGWTLLRTSTDSPFGDIEAHKEGEERFACSNVAFAKEMIDSKQRQRLTYLAKMLHQFGMTVEEIQDLDLDDLYAQMHGIEEAEAAS